MILSFSASVAPASFRAGRISALSDVLSGLCRTATREADGNTSLSSCSSFGWSSSDWVLTPVAFVPGRRRLLTIPMLTGSRTEMNTIGMVRVASRALSVASVPAATKMSGLSATSSAASAANRSSRPSANRRSTTRFCPSR
jgi:hypothetical protein